LVCAAVPIPCNGQDEKDSIEFQYIVKLIPNSNESDNSAGRTTKKEPDSGGDDDEFDIFDKELCESLKCYGRECGFFYNFDSDKTECSCIDPKGKLPICKSCDEDCGKNASCDLSGPKPRCLCNLIKAKGRRRRRRPKFPRCCKVSNCGRHATCSTKKRECVCKLKAFRGRRRRQKWTPRHKDSRCRKCRKKCKRNERCKKSRGRWRCTNPALRNCRPPQCVWVQSSTDNCIGEGKCRRGGLCEAGCGRNGYCCRKGSRRDNCPREARAASPTIHTCVKQNRTESTG